MGMEAKLLLIFIGLYAGTLLYEFRMDCVEFCHSI